MDRLTRWLAPLLLTASIYPAAFSHNELRQAAVITQLQRRVADLEKQLEWSKEAWKSEHALYLRANEGQCQWQAAWYHERDRSNDLFTAVEYVTGGWLQFKRREF